MRSSTQQTMQARWSPAEEEQAQEQSEGSNEHVPLGEADAEAFGDSGNDVAEDEPENDGKMMPDLKGLKQMQKGLQGMLQEATEEMCSHLASTDATLKVVLAGCRVVLQGVNAEIWNARTNRDDRFFLQGLYDGSLVSNHEDGHICDGDTITVLFERDPVAGRRPAKCKRVAHVYYGHVQTISWYVNRKDRTVHRVHLEEANASLVCKWYVKYLRQDDSHVLIDGKLAYALHVHEAEGVNNKVDMPNVLSAVRMRFCPEEKCCLLHPEDQQYVEKQRQRFTAYLNLTGAQKKKRGEFVKDPRPNHDKLKSQVDF